MNYKLMVVVVPDDEWEYVAGQVDSWALIGPDIQSFDEANGRLTIIEERYSEITN